MKKKKKEIQKPVRVIYVYSFLVILSIVVLLFIAYNNSPLIERIGEDGGIYLLMGRSINQGMILYTQLFDHKGPIIFFINALPQLLMKGPFGVWCTEVVVISLSVCLLYKLALEWIHAPSALLVPIGYLIGMSVTLCGGNYTEEFSNLFCILSLAIFMKWLSDEEKHLSHKNAFLLGVYFSLVFFMRPNNVVLIGVIIIFIGIEAIKNKSKEALVDSFYGILGIGVVTLPLLFYHIHHGNMGEMWNALLLHNLRYCKTGVQEVRLAWQLDTPFKRCLFVMCAMSIYTCIRCKINKEWLYTLFIAVSMVVLVISVGLGGRSYLHYLVLIMPIIALDIILILKYSTRDLKKLLAKHLYIPLSIMLIILSYKSYNLTEAYIFKSDLKDYKVATKALASYIPKDERDQVFGYDVPAMWFYLNDMMPCYRYFTMQSWMAESDPQIGESINYFVSNEKPKWMVTYFEAAGNNHYLLNEIERNYEKVAENESGYLYRRKE